MNFLQPNNHVEDTKDVAEIHFHYHQEAIVKDEHEQHSQDVFKDDCGLDLQRSIWDLYSYNRVFKLVESV